MTGPQGPPSHSLPGAGPRPPATRRGGRDIGRVRGLTQYREGNSKVLIHEYQAKELMRKAGIPVPKGRVAQVHEEVANIARELGSRAVVKAQVHVGGRGKAGGIKLADSPEQAGEAAGSILGMNLKGLSVHKVLVEEALDIQREFYLGITVDRDRARNVIIFSTEGGVDIEEVSAHNPQAILQTALDPLLGLRDFQVRGVAFASGLAKETLPQLQDIIRRLYQVFVDYDCSLAEINPLVLTGDGRLIAADGKINLDDNALHRQPELLALREIAEEDPLEREAHARNLAYVRLDGDVGIIGNGAGLVMTTLDMVSREGGRPADFLDLGGGSGAAVVKLALELVLSDTRVKGVLFNIFGGITRCDEVAKGIVAVAQEIKPSIPFVIRLSGTNEAEGRALLAQAGYKPVSSMKEAAQAIVAQVKEGK